MVHMFCSLGRHFALDVESGSVFEVSELARKLIEGRISPGSTASGDFSRYTAQEIADTQAEIDGLIKEGALFSPEPFFEQPLYNGDIKALCLNVSHRCNLACAYCFAGGGSYNTAAENMDFKTAAAAIDFLLQKSGARRRLEVDFFGGEPLLAFETVKQTVSYARSLEKEHGKEFRFTLTTNGLGLTDEIIAYLNAEMYNVVISMDGREKVHNFTRPDRGGKGTFKQTLDNALRFRKARGDKQYYIRGTFTAENKDFAADVLALNDYGFDQISLEPVILPDSHPLAFKEADVPQLCTQYEVLAREYVRRRCAQEDPGHSHKKGEHQNGKQSGGQKWFNFFHFMVDLSGGPCLRKRLTGCGAGSEYLAVSPSGDIYPCHRFDGQSAYRIGNVFTGEFDETLPRKFASSGLWSKKDCKSCFCKYFCSGGCAANSIEFGGDINSVYPLSCELMKKRTEAAIAIYVTEREKESISDC